METKTVAFLEWFRFARMIQGMAEALGDGGAKNFFLRRGKSHYYKRDLRGKIVEQQRKSHSPVRAFEGDKNQKGAF